MFNVCFLFVFCLFVCMVTDFSAAEKDSGVKLCVLVRLLSLMSLSHFGELWLARSRGGGTILQGRAVGICIRN